MIRKIINWLEKWASARHYGSLRIVYTQDYENKKDNDEN